MDSQGFCCLIMMGEEAVCVVQALAADGVKGIDEESRAELKRDFLQCVADTEPEQLSPNKKQAKEVSNDEVRSEVSNPNISATENALAFQDISSQPTESENAHHAECGELTSTCLENSSSYGSLSDEAGVQDNNHSSNDIDNDNNNNNDTSQNGKDTSTSRVVLEIPKHASSTGIRKITFKFSKKKEDYCYQPPAKDDNESSCGMGYVRDGDLDLYTRNMELKMSKKVVPDCYPTNVKKLLSTGILDGAVVKYIYNPLKVKHARVVFFIYLFRVSSYVLKLMSG